MTTPARPGEHPDVVAVLETLATLDRLPVDEHGAVYEEIQRRLSGLLGDVPRQLSLPETGDGGT